ncbi:ATP synthase F1 subunit delta [Paradesertivirga mongoliensis]|uniref:ATP synthase subunit delta n=1 Tax=Paradesertivirga mongoliensis TaxID=2100740 RepID=A0ABW4ZHK9_9SPHI|nr:ATP synthase F1 subunit delta [Pedobacter mongoliensis]
MSEIQVASRYAKSLIDLAEEQNSLEAVKADIESFVNVTRQSSQLQAVLKNPIIGIDKKKAILSQLFGPNSSKVVLSFFNIVVAKGRAEILYATAKEFMNEYNRRQGVLTAVVTSAAPLTEEQKSKIVSLVIEATNKKIVLETNIDPELIGGFVLKVGDKQVDTSIASSLTKLKKEFAQ